MNGKEIFSIALGLSEPWQIEEVEFKIESNNIKTLHIYIGFTKGYKFQDVEGNFCTVHDTLSRKWRHLDFFQHECYIHCNVPRINELSSCKVRQVSVPWAREGSGFTLLFEAYVMQLIEFEMPVAKVANLVNEYANRIWNVFQYWISIAYNTANHSTVKKIGIDETSSKKGHNYVTIAVDLDEHKVINAQVGKDANTIKLIKEYLETKGCKSEQITNTSIDLSPTFISGIMENFPNAQITFDRFHVKKLLNEAIDEVRKLERKEHEILKNHKYTFLKNQNNLTVRQKEERDKLIILLPNIGEAYRLKILFDDFWDMKNAEDAAGFLAYWTDLVTDSGIQPLIKFGNTVKSHWSGIVNFIKTRISNGVLEGINSKIQLAKKRARGYRNMDNFIAMIYFIAGKLKFDYPHKSA